MKTPNLSHRARRFFGRIFPIIAAAMVFCVLTLSRMDAYDAARLYLRTYAMLEHLLMSLTVTVCGGLLLDLAERHYS